MLPEREDVVDGGEIVGRDDVEGVVPNCDLEARAPFFFFAIECDGFGLGMARAGEEIVQRGDARHYGSESGGHLRVGHVGDVLVAVGEREIVKFGAEGFADLRGGGADVDDHAAFIDLIDGEAVGSEPSLDSFEVLRVNAVSGCELFGREPVVEVGGVGVVHGVDFFAEVGFGLRIAFEDEEQVVEAKIVCDGAAVVWCEGGRRGGVAGEGGVFGFVDGVGDLLAGNLGAQR